MTNRGRNFILACALAVPTLGGLPYHAAQAQPNVLNISTSRTHLITVEKGKPKTLRTQSSFYEIVVGDPEIANVQPLTNRSFYVLGITAGTTGIALFDENKRLIGSVDVEVSVDTTRLKTAIRENVPDADIKVTTTNGQVVLSGSAPDQVSADRAKKIASKFAGEDEDIINSVDVTSSQQVQLNVRFVEVNRNAGQELGVKINDLSYISNRNSPDSGSAGYSSVGNFVGRLVSGGLNVDVAIKAMEDRGVARRLAEPNLIARSGETASFLAGGEFPISVVGKDGDVSVQYKKFGVGLEFTPKVLKDGLISLEIEPEVSSLDRTLSNGFPVLSVRRAKTSVDLKSGPELHDGRALSGQ
jgi:pilus assembly protein CpaC